MIESDGRGEQEVCSRDAFTITEKEKITEPFFNLKLQSIGFSGINPNVLY